MLLLETHSWVYAGGRGLSDAAGPRDGGGGREHDRAASEAAVTPRLRERGQAGAREAVDIKTCVWVLGR
eukprot:1741134-Rhodomonas_salina.8